MTPQEKAEELFDKIYDSKDYDGYCNGCGLVFEQAKDIALIAVEEILNTLYSIPFGNALDNELEYWNEVKQEIEKL